MGLVSRLRAPISKPLTFTLYTRCEPPSADCRSHLYLTDKRFASFKLSQLYSTPVHMQRLQAILSPAIISARFRDCETPFSKLKGGKRAKTRHYKLWSFFWSRWLHCRSSLSACLGLKSAACRALGSVNSSFLANRCSSADCTGELRWAPLDV